MRACAVGFRPAVLISHALVAVGVSKQDIREQIWDYMESQNIADFPRPVHHRIPNFKVLKHSKGKQGVPT